MTGDVVLSVVIPVFNEEQCLVTLYQRLSPVIDAVAKRAEIIFVDDCSTDASFDRIAALAERDSRVIGVRLSWNEGSQTAILCGLAVAHGDVVVSLDADLQHPPELIPSMLDAWRKGSDVVHMVRRGREHKRLSRRVTAAVFYRVFNWFSDVQIVPYSADFRLLDRKALDALLESREEVRFLRAMVRRIGFRQSTLEYDAPPRHAGQSTYTLLRLASLALDAFFSYSRLSLLLPALLGPPTAVVAAAVLVLRPWDREPIGAAHLLSLWLLVVITALAYLGVLGAYLSRWAREAKRRPAFFVDRTVGRGLAMDAPRVRTGEAVRTLD